MINKDFSRTHVLVRTTLSRSSEITALVGKIEHSRAESSRRAARAPDRQPDPHDAHRERPRERADREPRDGDRRHLRRDGADVPFGARGPHRHDPQLRAGDHLLRPHGAHRRAAQPRHQHHRVGRARHRDRRHDPPDEPAVGGDQGERRPERGDAADVLERRQARALQLRPAVLRLREPRDLDLRAAAAVRRAVRDHHPGGDRHRAGPLPRAARDDAHHHAVGSARRQARKGPAQDDSAVRGSAAVTGAAGGAARGARDVPAGHDGGAPGRDRRPACTSSSTARRRSSSTRRPAPARARLRTRRRVRRDGPDPQQRAHGGRRRRRSARGHDGRQRALTRVQRRYPRTAAQIFLNLSKNPDDRCRPRRCQLDGALGETRQLDGRSARAARP